MPVSGGGSSKGKADGVSDSDARTPGGESGGGGYENPHSGKDGDGDAGGFFGHGGQTDIAYHGGGQAGAEGSETPNATTQGGGDIDGGGETGPKPGPTGPDQDLSPEYGREIEVDGRHIAIIDTSGISAAEAAGTTGVEGQAKASEHPGSG
jgi:hypothetical protein